MKRVRLTGFLLSTLLLLASSRPAFAAARNGTPVRVFAAASLSEAFTEMGRAFERSHPGVVVQFNFAGSQQLAAQLAQGAAADVFASADERWMKDAIEHDLVAHDPTVFARNRLAIIVPRTNPARIARLQDLTRRGTKLVVGAPTVPVGAYGREMLQKLSKDPTFGADFARLVLANVVSEEENVKAIVGKVQLGEADAGIVYRSDVTAAVSRYVRVFEIPSEANVLAEYPIATLKGARDEALAQAFVELVTSPAGQSVLERRGLIPALAKTP